MTFSTWLSGLDLLLWAFLDFCYYDVFELPDFHLGLGEALLFLKISDIENAFFWNAEVFWRK